MSNPYPVGIDPSGLPSSRDGASLASGLKVVNVTIAVGDTAIGTDRFEGDTATALASKNNTLWETEFENDLGIDDLIEELLFSFTGQGPVPMRTRRLAGTILASCYQNAEGL